MSTNFKAGNHGRVFYFWQTYFGQLKKAWYLIPPKQVCNPRWIGSYWMQIWSIEGNPSHPQFELVFDGKDLVLIWRPKTDSGVVEGWRKVWNYTLRAEEKKHLKCLWVKILPVRRSRVNRYKEQTDRVSIECRGDKLKETIPDREWPSVSRIEQNREREDLEEL